MLCPWYCTQTKWAYTLPVQTGRGYRMLCPQWVELPGQVILPGPKTQVLVKYSNREHNIHQNIHNRDTYSTIR